MNNELLKYLMESAVSLGFLYLLYWLLLRKTTHFGLSRWWLLSSMALSLLVPLINFPELAFFPSETQVTVDYKMYRSPLPSYELPPERSTTQQPTFDKPFKPKISIVVLLVLGSTIMLFRLMVSLVRLLYIYIHASRKSHCGEFVEVYSNKIKSPGSFFNLIFLPDEGLSKTEMDKIIDHEKFHMRFGHTFDLLVTEALVIVLWFNPFAWLLKASLMSVHEFQADEAVLKKGHDRKSYQLLLLRYNPDYQYWSLTNSFSHSKIKNRIILMNKPKSSPFPLWKSFLLIPAVVLLLIAWSEPLTENQDGVRTIKGQVFSIENNEPLEDAAVTMYAFTGLESNFYKLFRTGISTTTDSMGNYTLTGVPDSVTHLLFSIYNGKGHVGQHVPLENQDSLVDVRLSTSYEKINYFQKNRQGNWLSWKDWLIQNADIDLDSFSLNDKTDKPLYIIDGKISSHKDVEEISKKIKSITVIGDGFIYPGNLNDVNDVHVIKDAGRIMIRGRASNRIVLITTKNDSGKIKIND